MNEIAMRRLLLARLFWELYDALPRDGSTADQAVLDKVRPTLTGLYHAIGPSDVRRVYLVQASFASLNVNSIAWIHAEYRELLDAFREHQRKVIIASVAAQHVLPVVGLPEMVADMVAPLWSNPRAQ